MATLLVVCLMGPALTTGAMAQSSAEPETDDPLTPEERAWLHEHGPVRFAPRPDIAPFSLKGAEGETTGLELDLMNRISRNLGVTFDIVQVPDWDTAEDRLVRGEVDVLTPLVATEAGDAHMDYLEPHVQVSLVLYKRTDAPYENISMLADRPVAALEGAPTTLRFAEAHPEIAVVPVTDVEEGFDRLSRGEVVAFLVTDTAAGYHLQEAGRIGFVTLDRPIETILLHWAVRDGDTILAGILQQGMESIAPGERQRLYAFWTGQDISVPAEETTAMGDIPPIVLQILAVVAVVAVLAIFWGIALRRQVRVQTTYLRENRDALRRHKAELEATVRARTEALEEAAADLRRSNKELERFAYVASHDMQEPLRMVRAYLDLISSRYGEVLDEDGQEFLAYARDGAERMSVLIEDLLELSRIGRRPIGQETVELEQVVDQVVHDLGARMQESGAKVTLEDLPAVRGDPSYLRQLMQNLLSNAVKFQAPDKSPRIQILAAPAGDGMVGIMVADNGIGMAPEKTREIFEPFHRLHHRGEYPGTGIGLAICRRIVETHGGTIHAESDGPGKGTRFVFTLPGADHAQDVETGAPTSPEGEAATDGLRHVDRASRTLHDRLEEDLAEMRDVGPAVDDTRTQAAQQAVFGRSDGSAARRSERGLEPDRRARPEGDGARRFRAGP